ncbi:MAG: hypothetical protein J6P16_06015, partial [Eubacterium sp.]|nr:hypothetical protein [Eubacterium sp.]
KKNNFPPLTKEQEDQIREYYRGCPDFSTIYNRVCTARSGVFYPNYMPDDLYYGYIEPYYVDREAARYIDNKTFYYSIFAGEKMPELIVMRQGTLWLGPDSMPIDRKKVIRYIQDSEGELVLKIAENSERGQGVYVLREGTKVEDFKNAVRHIKSDIVVQKLIKQHPVTAEFHPWSVNSFRVATFLKQDGPVVTAKCFRIGGSKSRTDNIATGGFFLGFDDDGITKDRGMIKNGGVIYEHPDLHTQFAGVKLPSVEKVFDMAKRLHLRVPKFRIVSWDIGVDDEGEAVLIEANLSLGEISGVQACSGPIFGDLTRDICKEVFDL